MLLVYKKAPDFLRGLVLEEPAARRIVLHGLWYPNGLKAKYPELREQRWLYMLMGGEIVKFKVKGSGMTHWFKFLRDLSKRKLHTFQVEVKLDPASETNEELGKSYYAPAFTITKELTDEDIERLIQPHIEKLSGEFAAIAAYRAEKDQRAESVQEDMPVVQLDEEVEDEPMVSLDEE
jgi:hypothetical protein